MILSRNHLTHMIAPLKTVFDDVTIRSYIGYLIPTYNILVLLLH